MRELLRGGRLGKGKEGRIKMQIVRGFNVIRPVTRQSDCNRRGHDGGSATGGGVFWETLVRRVDDLGSAEVTESG